MVNPYIYKKDLALLLESAYERYNHFQFISPDALEPVLRYRTLADREIAGLIASSFAMGRVQSIMKITNHILLPLEPLYNTFMEKSVDQMKILFPNFVYRFFKLQDLENLFTGIKRALVQYGSIENCFKDGIKSGADSLVPAMSQFSQFMGSCFIPDAKKGSACKRLCLYLRWMVRRDEVDPGGWSSVNPSQLIVPMDTHMMRLSGILGLRTVRSADLKTALDVTHAFSIYQKQDPVKYDFCLTRAGIHPKLNDFDVVGHFQG